MTPKIIHYLQSILKTSNTLIFGLLFIGFFLIFPQRGNFGDDGNIFIIFQSNVIKYVEGNHNEPFFEYLQNKHTDFHKEHLADPADKNHYRLTGMYGLLQPSVQDFNVSIILSRVMEFSLYHIFLKQLDIEQCIVIYIFIVFLATFIYAYKFGNQILDKNFGIILAVIIVSNMYYIQLNRTFLFSHIAVYPLFFLMCFYYLFSMHTIRKQKNIRAVIGLSIAVALAFLNGYPNTNFVLLGLIGTFFVIFLPYIWLKNDKYRFINIKNYFYVITLSASIVLVVSGFWSTLLGYDFLYALKVIFRTRIWGMIFEGNLGYNVIMDYNVHYLVQKITSIVRLLFIESNFIYGAHEPSFLLHLNFLNIFERILLITGVVFWLINIRGKTLINLFLIYIFVFFWVRGISHKSGGPIGRTEFDFIFCVLFFVSYGFYGMFQYFTKFSSSNNTVKPPKLKPASILYSVLIIEIALNCFLFNYYYIYKYNEALGLHNGAYQLRKIYRNEISGKKNYLVLDVGQGNFYKYHIDNISLLEGDITYFSLEKFLEQFKSPDEFKAFLNNNPETEFYFVFPHNVERVANAQYRTDIRASLIRLHKYISLHDYHKLIKDRSGSPLYYIWKLSNKNTFSYLELNKSQPTYTIELNSIEAIKYFDFPSGVKSVHMEAGGETLDLDFSDLYFNKYHFSFNDKSVIEIFNGFNNDNKLLNIINNEAKSVHQSQHFYNGVRIDLLEATRAVSHIDFKYKIGVPVKSIYLNVPYLFFNDKDNINAFGIFMKTDEKKSWKRVYEKISNGSMLVSDQRNYELHDIFAKQNNVPLVSNYTNAFNGIVDGEMSSEISLRYRLKVFRKYVRPFSQTWHEETSPNHMIFNVDSSQHKGFLDKVNQIGKVKLTITFRDKLTTKYSTLARDYILGYGIVKKP